MPKSIKIKCFILFFAVFIVIARADQGIDFVDCGSYLVIRNVSVNSCISTPCVFSPGDNIIVKVLLSEVTNLDRTDLVTEAYLRMFGLKWKLDITPVNPCESQWACPVLTVNDLTYTADIKMLPDVLRRPAHIEVLLKNEEGDEEFQALCIEFSVDLQ